MAVFAVAVLLLMHYSHRIYTNTLKEERDRVSESAALHLRTIEALAMAIDAKYAPGRDHLKRVQTYADEIASVMNLFWEQVQAVRAAALLHDIGKLGVPEHLFSGSGKLAPEEVEKIKTHPTIGAEILERVRFPYPVAPIVRAHQERWDGGGYPEGIKGEDIPIGARILAVAERLDSLTAEGRSPGEAIDLVALEAGTRFDPKVIEAIQRHRAVLEQAIGMQCVARLAPALTPALFSGPSREAVSDDFLLSIAAARQEVQVVFDLNKDLGNSLSLDETFSVFAARLKRLIPHDSLVIYLPRGNVLFAAYACGEGSRLLSKSEIPIGHGISGRAAAIRRPLIEATLAGDPGAGRFSMFESALAFPLEGTAGVVAVLTLYSSKQDAFHTDHLRILLAVNTKVAVSIENALKYRQAESSAVTDDLTGLPNTRSLFLRLDAELSRCRREKTNLAVLVGDLDGFKQVNDRLGHLHGNKVLRAVAQGLRASCREYDYVARMGGDEFVLILPGLEPEAVRIRAAEVGRVAVEAGRAACGFDLVSMSVGEAVYPDDSADAEGLLAQADRRMYQAKARSRSAAQTASAETPDLEMSATPL
jgi:diguanylate cyclase (GGDEF)-like protein/putative nucleotidyltransferase with HDIG domain